MTTLTPQCFECKHFVNDREFTCKAFPEGIPDAILINDHDHKKEFVNDNGVRFERKDD